MGSFWNSPKDPSTISSVSMVPSPSPSPSPSESPTLTPTAPTPPSTTPPNPHLPTTLSCHTAFDAAFHCQSLGGQFANIYRYGSLRSCSEHWADFWFCVRTNRGGSGEEQRGKRIREWARAKEREKYYGSGDGGERRGSSEDVWEARRGGVRGAFGGDWGDLEMGKEEEGNM